MMLCPGSGDTPAPASKARELHDWFATLAEAKEDIEAWRREYNDSRPHRALGERTPNEFAKESAASHVLLRQQRAENSL